MENNLEMFLRCPRWFPFVTPVLNARSQATAALQGDHGQDVVTQTASGVEACAPGALSEGHQHAPSFI